MFTNIFSSECDMKRRTCGQLVVVAPLANCEGTRHCSSNLAAPRCPRTKKNKMICGSDNQFYSNECQMKRENCGLVFLIIYQLFISLLSEIKSTERYEISA